MLEHYCSLVSSRGILRSCAAHNANPVSSSPVIDPLVTKRSKSVYFCTEALQLFPGDWIYGPVPVVTGDSDLEPAYVAENQWSQNATDPRINPIPIGMDYHTMSEKPGTWGLERISAPAQERLLLNVLADSPVERKPQAYANWLHTIERGDRKECAQKVEIGSTVGEGHPIPRLSTWQRQVEFSYVLSPSGGGLDCHRTWEAIALRCIPIVKVSPLSRLYEPLPVLIVRDWADVTIENLKNLLPEFRSRKWDYSNMFLAHWMRKIHGFPTTPLMLTMAEWRETMTRTVA
jgi:hypothetical protein